jgi:AraC-like DNA-binding protein
MFHYREILPPVDLEHLVLSFWEFTVDAEAGGPLDHEIFPDGCISLLYRRNRRMGFSVLVTTGLHTRSITVPVFGGDVFWGLRLSPAAAGRVLGFDPGAMEKHLWEGIEPEYGIFDAAFLSKLAGCEDLESAGEVFASRLRARAIRPDDIDRKVQAAVALIEQSAGEVRVAAIAAAVDLSLRQFERRFKRSGGLSPKQYARNRRLRAAAAVLAGHDKVNWAERAAAMGFADQAHLAHEVSSITGNSPKTLARKVKKIDHGTLV